MFNPCFVKNSLIDKSIQKPSLWTYFGIAILATHKDITRIPQIYIDVHRCNIYLPVYPLLWIKVKWIFKLLPYLENRWYFSGFLWKAGYSGNRKFQWNLSWKLWELKGLNIRIINQFLEKNHRRKDSKIEGK